MQWFRVLRIKTLFARLVLLVLLVMLLSQTIAWMTYTRERDERSITQFSKVKVTQVLALKHTLETESIELQELALAKLADDFDAHLVPLSRTDDLGAPLTAPQFDAVAKQLRDAVGAKTELRTTLHQGVPVVWIPLSSDTQAYWIGLPASAARPGFPARTFVITGLLIAFLLMIAYMIARRVVLPLKSLSDAVTAIRNGEKPEAVPETGPDEIANVSREFNRMRETLSNHERERAIMLAGVSHDLRTPLTRIKLELEMSDLPEATKTAVALDVEEIERTLGQFLDFARTAEKMQVESFPLEPWLSERVSRERMRRGDVVSLNVQSQVDVMGNAASLDRAIANLIDNAFRYGSDDVNVTVLAVNPTRVAIDVADRGPGIAPDEVPRLLQPFTRGDPARGNTDGAGLGLAIVQRIAQTHGGSLVLFAREGGGMIARITLPISRAPSAS